MGKLKINCSDVGAGSILVLEVQERQLSLFVSHLFRALFWSSSFKWLPVPHLVPFIFAGSSSSFASFTSSWVALSMWLQILLAIQLWTVLSRVCVVTISIADRALNLSKNWAQRSSFLVGQRVEVVDYRRLVVGLAEHAELKREVSQQETQGKAILHFTSRTMMAWLTAASPASELSLRRFSCVSFSLLLKLRRRLADLVGAVSMDGVDARCGPKVLKSSL